MKIVFLSGNTFWTKDWIRRFTVGNRRQKWQTESSRRPSFVIEAEDSKKSVTSDIPSRAPLSWPAAPVSKLLHKLQNPRADDPIRSRSVSLTSSTNLSNPSVGAVFGSCFVVSCFPAKLASFWDPDRMSLIHLCILLAVFPIATGFAAIPPIIGDVSTTRSTTASKSSLNSMTTEVAVGDTLPSVELKELSQEGGTPEAVNLADLCAGKKVAIFGVPGAFTPGCSKSHLPSFIEAQDTLKAKGVDLTICVATNDAYTMEAWGRTSGGAAAGIRFLADDTGALTKAWCLVKETPVGIRTTRFSLIADDNKVTQYFSSAKQSSDTWAPAVLAAL